MPVEARRPRRGAWRPDTRRSAASAARTRPRRPRRDQPDLDPLPPHRRTGCPPRVGRCRSCPSSASRAPDVTCRAPDDGLESFVRRFHEHLTERRHDNGRRPMTHAMELGPRLVVLIEPNVSISNSGRVEVPSGARRILTPVEAEDREDARTQRSWDRGHGGPPVDHVTTQSPDLDSPGYVRGMASGRTNEVRSAGKTRASMTPTVPYVG